MDHLQHLPFSALFLSSPLLWTQTSLLSMKISPWEAGKNRTLPDLVSMVDVPSLGSCVLQEMSSQRGHCVLVRHFECSHLFLKRKGALGMDDRLHFRL